MKQRHGFKIILLFMLFLVSGCGEKLPEAFKAQSMKFMEDGSAISSISSTGVNYQEMRRLFVRAKGSYGLLEATWPKDKFNETRLSFEKAWRAWELTLKLWELKLGDKDNPVEPDVNGYLDFMAFAAHNDLRDKIITRIHPPSYIVKHYRGKQYLPFSENISLLMGYGSREFQKGRQILLA